MAAATPPHEAARGASGGCAFTLPLLASLSNRNLLP
jgi:hypothetical protein